MPLMEVKAAGSGAGDIELSGMPNLLRVFMGEQAGGGYEGDTVVLVETNIDDMDPRVYEYVIERLLQAGALDAWLTPVIMKKSRPAVVSPRFRSRGKKSAIIDIIMEETTTFGVPHIGAFAPEARAGIQGNSDSGRQSAGKGRTKKRKDIEGRPGVRRRESGGKEVVYPT